MNILKLTIDDIGKEVFAGSGPGGTNLGGAGTYGYPATPNIDALIAAGCLFTRANVEQLCSPTRAAIETGRHPERTGVTDIIRDDQDTSSTQPCLQESEYTIAKCLKAIGYRTACFGKWHLGNVNCGGREHPNRMGFEVYAGNLFNLANSNFHIVNGDNKREGYFAWDQTLGAKPSVCTAFHTTQVVNNALRWIHDQREPWYCNVCFFGAHSPFINNTGISPAAVNAPPVSLYDEATWSSAQSGTPSTTATMHAYRAHIEALDTEIGRLLATIDYTDTLVVLVSDNGSSTTTLEQEVHPTIGAYPAGRGKDTPYETGTWSLLAMRGPGVSAGTRYESIVSAVDLFPTILGAAGCALPATTLDGVSLVAAMGGDNTPVRATSYGQWAQPMGIGVERVVQEWFIIGDADGSGAGRYTLIKPSISGTHELYDNLPSGSYNPMQATNLLLGTLTAGEAAAYAYLVDAAETLMESFP